MESNYYFSDKNREYRTYHTIVDNGVCYSKIIFHKIKWYISDKPDIVDLEKSWAIEIMQSIINGNSFGDFEGIIVLDDSKEVVIWLHWEIMDAWDGWK
jgi:hypothetical protein